MIRSVVHPATRALRRAHKQRSRRAWAIMGFVLILASILVAFGYFAQVGWVGLAEALVRTTYRLALSYGIALIIGASVALLVGWSPLADYLFPIFDILQNIPSFALLPLFIYFFGTRDEMIILFAVSSIVWPILFAVLTAIKSAHSDLNDAATIFGARGFRRVTAYLAPLSFPAILTGSVVGIAIGWEAVIGAEIIANNSGFGAYIASAGVGGVTPGTIAGTLGILAIVFVLNRLIWAPLLAESAHHYSE